MAASPRAASSSAPLGPAVTGTFKSALRHTLHAALGVVPAAMLVRLGMPALGGLVFLIIATIAVACWVVGSGDRTERVSRLLLACRGDAACLRGNMGDDNQLDRRSDD